MKIRGLLLPASLTIGSVVAAADFCRTRVPQRCFLPRYAYQTSRPSNPRSSGSSFAILLPAGDAFAIDVAAAAENMGGFDGPWPIPVEGCIVRPRSDTREAFVVSSQDAPGPGAQGKFLKMNQSELRIDHCWLARVGFTAFSDGAWILQFDANQHPGTMPRPRQPEFIRFKRNRFYVKAQGLPFVDDGEEGILASPQLFEINVQPFMVQQSEEKPMRISGRSQAISRAFSRLEGLKVVLRYE